jgi:hypothetical protein
VLLAEGVAGTPRSRAAFPLASLRLAKWRVARANIIITRFVNALNDGRIKLTKLVLVVAGEGRLHFPSLNVPTTIIHNILFSMSIADGRSARNTKKLTKNSDRFTGSRIDMISLTLAIKLLGGVARAISGRLGSDFADRDSTMSPNARKIRRFLITTGARTEIRGSVVKNERMIVRATRQATILAYGEITNAIIRYRPKADGLGRDLTRPIDAQSLEKIAEMVGL